MDFERQQRVRDAYSLISRGSFAVRNWLQALACESDEHSCFQKNQEAREELA